MRKAWLWVGETWWRRNGNVGKRDRGGRGFLFMGESLEHGEDRSVEDKRGVRDNRDGSLCLCKSFPCLWCCLLSWVLG